MIDAALIGAVGGAPTRDNVDEAADRTSRRILDAALQEAGAVGLQRITVEDVVRRAGASRPTAAIPAELLKMGSAFIANYIHGEAPGSPTQPVRWGAAELRRFAREVLTPMVERALG